MKIQEVILRAIAKKITWWQTAEIIGISDRSMRRWRERLEEFGYDGLFDRRRGQPSPKRVPLATVEQVLGLYRDRYFDLDVQHFHEKLGAQHGIHLSYLGKTSSTRGRTGGAGEQAGECIASGGNGGRGACCCTSTAAVIAGSRTSPGTT